MEDRRKHVFVLDPIQRDDETPIIFLGCRPSKIQKELIYHWRYIFEYEGDYSNEVLDNVGHIVSKQYKNSMEILEDYNKLIDEGYVMHRWLLEE